MIAIMVETTVDGTKANEAIGLREYLDGIGSIVSGHPAAWVRCDLQKIEIRDRFVRMELIAPDADQRKRAQASGGCFPDAYERMRRAFADNGITLDAGAKILVRIRAKVDANYGLSVEILDIDPTYTLGDLRTRMEAIRAKLRASGEWDRNRSLPPPTDFVRVAVIAPSGAAGLGDFRATADRLQSAGIVEFEYHQAAFQSADAPAGIIAALRSIYPRAKAGGFCAVAIIRGGGAAGDLTWLVDHALVRATCLTPVPVITGIGHQRDETLLDEVACIRCHTPSMAVGHVKTTAFNAAMAALDAIATIRAHSAAELSRSETALATSSTTANSHAMRAITAAGDAVTRRRGDATRTGVEAMYVATSFITSAGAAVRSAAARTLAAAANAVATTSVGIAAAPDVILSAATTRLADTTRGIRDAARRDAETMARVVSSAKAMARSSAEATLASVGHAVSETHRAASRNAAAALAIPKPTDLQGTTIAQAGRMVAIAAGSVDAARARAEAMDPAYVVAAGYAIMRGADDRPLTNRDSVRDAGRVTAQMRDGSVNLTVEGTTE